MPNKSRPLIGICTRMDLDSDRFYLRKHYSEAIFQAGGTLVLLPLIDKREYAQQYPLGLQWHPEIGWEPDEFSRKIFASFVAASAETQG